MSGTTSIKEIVIKKAREKYGSLYRYAKATGKKFDYIYKVLIGDSVSRPVIFQLAKDLGIPELCYLYEQFLHEKKNANKKKAYQSKEVSLLDKTKEAKNE